MASSRTILLTIGLLFLIPIKSWSQDLNTRGNELWTGISIKYKLNKKLQFNLDQQVRMSQNMQAIRSSFFEFGARYKWNKYVSTKVQYRYTIRNEQRNVNRFTVDAIAKWKWKSADLKFSYRTRFQHAMVVYTGQPFTYLRNRLRMSYYGFKRLEPFLSYENFFKFNFHNEFRGNRYVLGCDVKLNKQMDLTLIYGIDQEMNTKNPTSRNIFSAVLSYSF
ncbi:DUF2490 domain-containing protein [Crocinitomicaceae bacterium]|nr:DUF2490 domain-containing protein [Crocinitomicaceae bacterium]